MKDNEDKLDQKAENEIKKIKLSLEYGTDFSQSSISKNLPAETERQFLNYIEEWERQAAQCKTTSVFERIGRPSFRPVAEVPEEEISNELDAAIEILNNSGIQITALTDLSDREMYRFITEELVNQLLNDIRIQGMMTCFTYEDFHPNHRYDIENRCTEFIEYLAQDEHRLIPWGIADEVTVGAKSYTKEQLNEQIISFHRLFSNLELLEYNYLSHTLNETEDEATTIALVRYLSVTTDGQKAEISGNCRFGLKCEYGWWTIYYLETPCKMI